jgi:hypothetical protein
MGPNAYRIEAAPITVHSNLNIMIIQIYAAYGGRNHLSSFKPFKITQYVIPQLPFPESI